MVRCFCINLNHDTKSAFSLLKVSIQPRDIPQLFEFKFRPRVGREQLISNV